MSRVAAARRRARRIRVRAIAFRVAGNRTPEVHRIADRISAR